MVFLLSISRDFVVSSKGLRIGCVISLWHSPGAPYYN